MLVPLQSRTRCTQSRTKTYRLRERSDGARPREPSLARETGIPVRDTGRPLWRLAGGVLTGAKAGSRYLADAHVVADYGQGYYA